MSKKFINALSITLTVAFMLVSATACSKPDQKTTNDAAKTAATTSAPTQAPNHADKNSLGGEWLQGTGGLKMPVSDKEVVLKIAMAEHATYPIKSHDSNPWLQNITKLTGVKMDIQAIPQTNYKEKLNIMLNTNDLPDIIWRTEDDAKINELGQKGVFLAYSDYLKDMPNLKRVMDEKTDVKKAYTAANGKMYVLPLLVNSTLTEGLLVREDIMTKTS